MHPKRDHEALDAWFVCLKKALGGFGVVQWAKLFQGNEFFRHSNILLLDWMLRRYEKMFYMTHAACKTLSRSDIEAVQRGDVGGPALHVVHRALVHPLQGKGIPCPVYTSAA